MVFKVARKYVVKECGDSAMRKALSHCRAEIERMVVKGNEVCITFTDRWRTEYDDLEIHKLMSMFVSNIRHEVILREIILVPEWGKSNNLHYHGVVVGMAKELSKFKRMLNLQFGRSRVSYISYPQSYVDYVMKDTADNLDGYGYIYYDYDARRSRESVENYFDEIPVVITRAHKMTAPKRKVEIKVDNKGKYDVRNVYVISHGSAETDANDFPDLCIVDG